MSYRHRNRVNILNDKRDSFCGIGTRKIKLRLNKLSNYNSLAKIYRLALELEDVNICAKKYRGEYRDTYYEKKDELVKKLSSLCQELNIPHGYKENDGFPKYIVYFDLPGCEQISFHINNIPKMPIYSLDWDGKVDSTMFKLEKAILSNFPNINLESFKL